MLKIILSFIFLIFLLNTTYSYNIEKLDGIGTSCEWCNKDNNQKVYFYYNKFDGIYSNNYQFFENENLLNDYCKKNQEDCSKNKYIKKPDGTVLKTIEVEKYTIDELKNKFKEISYSEKQIDEIIQGIISPFPNKYKRDTFYNSLYNYSDTIKLSSFIKDNLNSLKFDIENEGIKLEIIKGYVSSKIKENYSPFHFGTTIVVSDSNNSFFEKKGYKYGFVSVSDGCNRNFDSKNTYRWISVPLSVNFQKYKQSGKYNCIDEYFLDLSKRKKVITNGVKDITSVLITPYRYTLFGKNFIDHFAYLENDFDVTLLKKYIPNLENTVDTINLELLITYEGFVDWKTFLKNIKFLKGIKQKKYYIIQGNRISFFIPKQNNNIIKGEIKNNKGEIIHIDFNAKKQEDYIICSIKNCDTKLKGDIFKIKDDIILIIKQNKYSYGKYYSIEDIKNKLIKKDIYLFYYLPYVISSNGISIVDKITKDNIDIINLLYIGKDGSISKNFFKDKEGNLFIYKKDLPSKEIFNYEVDFTNFKELLNSPKIGMIIYGKIIPAKFYSYLETKKDNLTSKTGIFKVLTEDINPNDYKEMFISLYNLKKDFSILDNVNFYLIYDKEITKSTPVMCIDNECYLPEKQDEEYFKRTFNISKIEEFIKKRGNIKEIEKMVFEMNKLEYIPKEYLYIKNSLSYKLGLPYFFYLYGDKIKIIFGIFFIIIGIFYFFKRNNKSVYNKILYILTYIKLCECLIESKMKMKNK